MARLLSGSRIIDDPWQIVRNTDEALPSGPVLLPLSRWLADRDAFAERRDVGIWIDTHEEPETIAREDVARLPVVAVNFPEFHDGRGLSIGVLLRTRAGFEGDLRAIGDVQQDLLSYLVRCGFTSFVLRAEADLERAAEHLRVMSDYYQGSATEPQPLFRRGR